VYLKCLEMIGFKSFADKTKLEFEPGMTAIIGPNGCGKSNVADSLRWVLGEQSAKALRGSKMEDCIFNGTDKRKPLGMAEVSVTFADCEGVLDTEFHEVTITRRVFRSGEGQYFINKTPCRLKDIHRLFMDTGVGTSSYSMMEQGRIDAILSARPEDRRQIFEEASGIMKFKADKKEAIRKLEHTETNLLRLADVIREVKRQIGSLQRQAGKARRYQALQTELRGLDLYVTRKRLTAADHEIADTEARLKALTTQQEGLLKEVREIENDSAQRREAMMATEREMGTLLEAGVQARSRLDHTREMIGMNRQRIEEYRTLTERDAREIDETGRQLAEQREAVAAQQAAIDAARGEREKAREALQLATNRLESHRDQVERLRGTIQDLREEAVELESLSARLQNELVELDAHERSTVIQREKLAAEKTQLARVVESFTARETALNDELTALRNHVADDEARLENRERERTTMVAAIDDARAGTSELERQAAGVQARVEMLAESESNDDGFPDGARRVLNNPAEFGLSSDQFLGTLASRLDVEPGYRLALEAALRTWIDALVVRDREAAVALAVNLLDKRGGSARLVPAVGGSVPAADVPGDRLIDHLAGDSDVRAILERLLGNVVVVDRADALPADVPPHLVYVTRDGIVLDGAGVVEIWQPDAETANPLARRRFLGESRESLSQIEARIGEARTRVQDLIAKRDALAVQVQAERSKREDSQRVLAQKEGELQLVAREGREAGQRLETVTWESQELTRQDHSGHEERQAISQRLREVQEQRANVSKDIGAHTQALRTLEDELAELQTAVTDQRVRHEGMNQKVLHLTAQCQSTENRIRDLESAVAGRERGMQTYAASMERLENEIGEAEGRIADMEAAVKENRTRTDALQESRERQAREIKQVETQLTNRRTVLDDLRETRSETEVHLTEHRMRRQNQFERITADYNLSVEQFLAEPDPAWPEDTPPSMDALETSIAELRTKLDAMGPVNLVAIDEYKELEERHEFLTTQEQDLVSAKQQLMDMIRKINRTTTEMFRSTFEQVNENFQATFQNLFNGGSAKLVLVNEEDVLECGIEIIARPPGKRLQNVSLLSGGERTMTAVALLFAIYMIKPSPFCMLDELDAALDESNIGRFVSMLQGFLGQSQFVLITHNRQTISAADILYGVTMAERGISRIVSMRFRHHEPAGGETKMPIPEPVGMS
jgi:chromosome segregation protein